MSSAASRLLRSSKNASLQNLIQRHLFRHSAVAASGVSVTELLSTVPERPSWNQVKSDRPKSKFTILPAEQASCNAAKAAAENMKKYSSSGADVYFLQDVFGLSCVDESGIVKIRARGSDSDIDNDSDQGWEDVPDDTDLEDGDEDYDDDDDDDHADDEDFGEYEKRKKRF